MTITQQEGQALTQAVTELAEVVRGLQKMIRDDYPSRDELESKFVTKYGIKKRRRQFTILVVIAIVASYFFSMGTVSYCFLGGNSDGSVNPKPLCRIVPGYQAAVDNNQKVIGVFKKIVAKTETNEQRIEKLEQGK